MKEIIIQTESESESNPNRTNNTATANEGITEWLRKIETRRKSTKWSLTVKPEGKEPKKGIG